MAFLVAAVLPLKDLSLLVLMVVLLAFLLAQVLVQALSEALPLDQMALLF